MKTLNFPGVKQRHREETAARKVVSDAMTPVQRLEKLDEGGYAATKERARLHAKHDRMKAEVEKSRANKKAE